MEKPLHVRVAEALGHPARWACGVTNESGWYHAAGPLYRDPIPRYDTDWAATGPLIERFGLAVFPTSKSTLEKTSFGPWTASSLEYASCESGPSALIATCKLLLSLHTAGHLGPRVDRPATAPADQRAPVE